MGISRRSRIDFFCRYLRPGLPLADRLRPQDDLRRERRHPGLRQRRGLRRDAGDRRQPDRRPPGVRQPHEAAAAPGRAADRRRPAADRPRAHAAHRGRLPPAAPAGHQRRTADGDGARHRHRGPARRGLHPRALRLGGVPRLGGVRRPTSSNSPEVPSRTPASTRAQVRAAARLYATGGNAAIYYGLGVTEHSQGSTTVMAIANLAMATGNIGRPGVGVNPLRGQNNVQGACDMGSFPHELSGYRHISDDATRELFEKRLGRHARPRAGPAHPQHARRRRSTGVFRRSTSRARTSSSPTPNTKHVSAGLDGDGLRHRPGPVPQRDRQLRPRVPARLDLPREGRHLHQRRAPHPAGAQGDGAEERL